MKARRLRRHQEVYWCQSSRGWSPGVECPIYEPYYQLEFELLPCGVPWGILQRYYVHHSRTLAPTMIFASFESMGEIGR